MVLAARFFIISFLEKLKSDYEASVLALCNICFGNDFDPSFNEEDSIPYGSFMFSY